MTDHSEPRLVERFSLFASAAAIFSGAVGLSVLAGWTFHVLGLLTWGCATPMAPNAAVCVLLASASLWLLRKQGGQSAVTAKRLAAKTAAVIVSLVGVFSLAEHLFRLNLGIDQLLLVKPLAGQIAGARILMSPVAASVLLLIGTALLLIDWRTRRGDWPAQFVIVGAAVGSAFGLLGLILGPGISAITLALPAVVCYFLLAFGLLSSRATWALGGMLTSSSRGARLLRRAIPAALLVLSLIGLLISKPLLTGVHFTWIEVSVLALFCSILLAGFVAWMAFIVERGEAERKKLEEALDVGKEQIDRLLDRIEEPEAEALLRRKVHAGFAVAVLLTGILGLLSWRMAQQAAEDADWIAHTQEVTARLELTLRHLDDVETGERGFAMTGTQAFLDPFEAGKFAVGDDVRALRLLVVDNPDQERRVDALERQANARIAAAEGIVALRHGTGKVPTETQLESGKRVMDETRVTVARMESEEKSLLEKRSDRVSSLRRSSISVIAIGSLLGVLFLSIAGITVSREIGISARARAQVSALNADLERRVVWRTEALSESEGRLSNIVQSAMDAIITTDGQQRILVFNTAAEKMFRCPATEALGQPITRFIPQRYHAVHDEHIKKFGENGATARTMGGLGTLWGVRVDGEEFRIEASISHIKTGDRNLFTVILRDVTERVQAEALREHLAAVVNSSDDAIISKDLNGTINGWNSGAEKIFGYAASEAVGKPVLMLLPPDCVNEESDILARIRKGESVEHFETVRVRKDGTRIGVSVTISPIRDAAGTIVGASKIARDITERNRAEEALRQSDARRRFALETAKLGEWELDLTTLQAARSLRHDAIFGYEAPLPEWSFDIFLRHVHADDRQRVGEYFQSYVRTGKRWEFECRIVCANGDIRWIWACGDHYRDSSGHASHMFGIVEDITERKLREEQLRASEERFRLFVEHAPAALAMFDREMRYLHMSRRWRTDYALGDRNLEGLSHYELFPEVPERWKEIHRRGLAGEVVRNDDDRFERPDGSVQWIRWEVRPWYERTGGIAGIVIFAEDITERKRAEKVLAEQTLELSRYAEKLSDSQEALQTQTLMLQSVLDSMSEGLVAADQNGKFIIWNPAAQRIVGMGAADVPSEEWNKHYGVFLSDTVTPFPPEQNPLSRAIHGEACSTELFLRNAELEEGAWIDISAGPLRDKRGVLCGGVAAFRDITQRKKDEQEIRKLNDELERRVIERTAQLEAANKELADQRFAVDQHAIVAVTDTHGTITYVNDRFCDISGYSRKELIGQNHRILKSDQHSPDFFEAMYRTIAKGKVWRGEVKNRAKDGSFFWLDSTIVPFLGTDGKPWQYVAIRADITQLKQAEVRDRQRTAELEAANKELEAFSYSVSHDLRAPLRHISGFSKMLVEEFGSTLDPTAQHYLDRIQSGTQKMGLLVDELLALARVGRQALNRQPTQLNAIVEEVIAMLEPESEGREVEWVITDLPMVECDPVLVKQVFQNLLANALKFTRSRGGVDGARAKTPAPARAIIEVSYKEEDGQLVFTVRDNGIGFNMKYVDKLFGVFQRLHRSEDFEGTGIGLATVQRIVQKHGGRVWAEGELEKGAAFHFTLSTSTRAELKSNGATAGGRL